MKKNILKATLVVAFALIAGMNVYNAQQSDVMSDLALANVEALASGESSNLRCHPRFPIFYKSLRLFPRTHTDLYRRLSQL